MGTISPDRLQLPRSTTQLVGPENSGPPRHKPGEHFLKGPIPWNWLQKASMLPGKSLHVGIGLWKRSGMQKSRTVKLSNVAMEDIGVDRFAKRRALEALEKAGLISVQRGQGRSPIVTLLNAPADR